MDMETDSVPEYLKEQEELRFQIASDLHLEFFGEEFNQYPKDLLKPVAPVLALLGDIGYPFEPHFERFLTEQTEKFELVLLLPGNHEYYNKPLTATNKIKTHDEIEAKMEEICNNNPKLIYMNKNTVKIANIRIIGAALWTYVPPQARIPVASSLNDYNLIYKKNGNGNPVQIDISDTIMWHEQQLLYIAEQMKISRLNHEKKIVVLTHHTPSLVGASAPRYSGPNLNPVNFGFSNSLEYLFKNCERENNSNLDVWCYGHTHYVNNTEMYGTRLISNQRGYQGSPDNQRYDPKLVISVSEWGEAEEDSELC